MYGPTEAFKAAGCSATNLGACEVTESAVPADWASPDFDDLGWEQATEHTLRQSAGDATRTMAMVSAAPLRNWVVWNIPASVTSLVSGNPESIGDEGSNKDGAEIGYTPPCSPGDAVHDYTIRIYALSASPEDLGSGDNLSVGWDEFIAAVESLSMGMAEISFTN